MGGHGPPDIGGMISLKVDNLTYRTTTDDVRDMFEPFGKLGDVYIPRDNYTKESRGFAFVRYFEERDAEEAIKDLDGKDVQGRQLRVSIASRPRPEIQPRDERGGGGGGGGYDRDHYDDRRDDRRGNDRRGGDRYGGGRDRDRRDDRRDSRRSRSPARRERSHDREDRGRDRYDRDRRSRSRS